MEQKTIIKQFEPNFEYLINLINKSGCLQHANKDNIATCSQEDNVIVFPFHEYKMTFTFHIYDYDKVEKSLIPVNEQSLTCGLTMTKIHLEYMLSTNKIASRFNSFCREYKTFYKLSGNDEDKTSYMIKAMLMFTFFDIDYNVDTLHSFALKL